MRCIQEYCGTVDPAALAVIERLEADAPERPLHEEFVTAMAGGNDRIWRHAAEYAALHPEYVRALKELA